MHLNIIKSSVSMLVVVTTMWASAAQAEPIQGAGSTFAAPAIGKWAKNYQIARTDGGDFTSPDWTVDYEPVGSLAGVLRLIQPEMDFGATDAPLPPEEIAKRGYAQFPILIGGVAIVANIPDVKAGALKLTGQQIADIYLGKIQNWSDAAIKETNPDLKLPDLRISVLHRKDGSGTTAVFTQFLSNASSEWKSKLGSDQLMSWPIGAGIEGTQGLTRAVGSATGSIAYVEYGQVQRAGLAYAQIKNKAGRFVKPERAAFQAAASAIDWSKTKDFYQQLNDQPGDASYPLTAATFAVTPNGRISSGRLRRVHDFFRLAFEAKGAEDASGLGYVPLPPALVDMVHRYWEYGNKKTGG